MFKNYLLIAIRSMKRNKTFSVINIFGLALGIACCLLLMLFIQHELSIDTHHKEVNNLYRINTHIVRDNHAEDLGVCSPPLAMAMAIEIPEIEKALRLVSPPGVTENLIRYESKVFYETDGYIADSTLFDLFTYEFTEGDPEKALVHPNSVVISEVMAQKLFGHLPALNKVISITQEGPEGDFKITGVVKDLNRSHVKVNFFISMTSFGGLAALIRTSQEWAGQNFVPSYVRLQEGSDPDAVEKKMNDLLMKHGAEKIRSFGFSKRVSLEPLSDIYLKSSVEKTPRIIYLYVIGSIAMFILLIACVNFINLSTAKAVRRANEIGVRKVMGAARSTLVQQILCEAMMIVLIAILLSFLIVDFSLPFFNTLTGKDILIDGTNIIPVSLILTGLTLTTGILAGSYPAFYISSFQPAHVLRGKFNLHSSGLLRKSLVVFQFVIAIVLVCGMITMTRQIRFIRDKDLGFDTRARIVLPLRTPAAKQAYAVLKNQYLSNSRIKKVSGADYLPGLYWNDIVLFRQGTSMEEGIAHFMNDVDHDYNDILNIRLLAGRTFTGQSAAEDNKIIINAMSAQALGYTPAEAIGQKIGQTIFRDSQGTFITYEVIGVMEDFHFMSLREAIAPAFVKYPTPGYGETFDNMLIQVEDDDLPGTITDLEKIWKNGISDTPFEYTFLDESMQKLYSEEQKISRIIAIFTIIAFIICCLGLYGLSSYLAERRFKEIGLRKVLGASVHQIISLMSMEFIKLVCIAFIIAIPLIWYSMDLWLESFAYKTKIDVLVFLYGGGLALAIALLTISFESLRAALQNPVHTLRNE